MISPSLFQVHFHLTQVIFLICRLYPGSVPLIAKTIFAASRDMIFHILTRGAGYLCIEGEATPLRVGDGDVIVFPHGHAH